jgi:hypothetical protein
MKAADELVRVAKCPLDAAFPPYIEPDDSTHIGVTRTLDAVTTIRVALSLRMP